MLTRDMYLICTLPLRATLLIDHAGYIFTLIRICFRIAPKVIKILRLLILQGETL